MKTKTILFCLIILTSFMACSGGRSLSGDIKNPAISMFPGGTVSWSALYKGYKTDFHPIDLAIASDGSDYKGVLTYPNTKIKFNIYGSVDEDPKTIEAIVSPDEVSGVLLLTEQDGSIVLTANGQRKRISTDHPAHFKLTESYEGMDTGHFNCIMSKGVLNLYYQAAENPVGSTYSLQKVESLQEAIPQKRKHITESWESANEDYHLVVTYTPERPNLEFYDASSGMTYKNNWELSMTPNLQNWSTALFDDKDLEVGQLYGSLLKNGNMELTYSLGRAPEKQLSLNPVNSIKGQHFTSEDFYTECEFQYPLIGSKGSFDAQVLSKVKSKTEVYEASRDSLLEIVGNSLDPKLRMDLRFYSYYHCFYLDENLASYQITFQSTHDETDELSVNYDIKADRLIELSDLFIKPAVANAFIDNYLILKARDLEFSVDPDFVGFLATRPFKHFGFNASGIRMYTDFNGIYGSVSILIPYEELQPYFREEHPLIKFL